MTHEIDPRPARDWPIPPMDKGSGWKDSAFTVEMGNLILQRIADGETVKAITAHPAMPAYCTVFRWMQMVPEFGEAVAEVRAELARRRLALADETRRARGRRRKGGGQREQASAQALGALLDRIRFGCSLTEAVAARGAPSFKMVYSRVRKCPGFRAAFTEACRVRDVSLELERYDLIDTAVRGMLNETSRLVRELEGRRGRLRPKLYRPAPPGPPQQA